MNKKKDTSLLFKMTFILTIILLIGVSYTVYDLYSEYKSPDNIEEIQPETLIALDEFTIKLSDGHYAKLSMNLGIVVEEEDISTVEELKPILRDKLITNLMSLTSEDLSVNGLNATKNILLLELSPLLPNAKIQNIYLDNLIVQ